MRKILLILLLFGIFGCSQQPSSDEKVEDSLQSFLDTYRKEIGAPGIVMSVSLSKKAPILDFVSGVTERAKKTPSPVTSQNLFQIGSITKTFVSALILQLEAEGILKIDDTIGETILKFGQWLPENESKIWEKISIKQLLNMTSGIYSYTDDPQFNQTMALNPEKQWSFEELLQIAVQHPLLFSEGKGWSYSDTNYILLERLVEAVTKFSLGEEIKRRFIQPFDLKNTYYIPHAYPIEILNRMVHGYAEPGGGFSPPAPAGTDLTLLNLSAAGGAGAMVSNAHDIVLWGRALFGGSVLPEKQFREMTTVACMEGDSACLAGTNYPPISPYDGYGLGIYYISQPKSRELSNFGSMWFYVGFTPGYYSCLLWIPKKDLILAMNVDITSEKSKNLLKDGLLKALLLIPPKG